MPHGPDQPRSRVVRRAPARDRRRVRPAARRLPRRARALRRPPRRVHAALPAGVRASFALLPWVGEDFFPAVDSGQFKLHLRAPTGTRIEETALLCDRVERIVREVIPPAEMAGIIDNIGLPYSGLNLSYSNSAPIGAGDADIMVALGPGSPADRRLHPRPAAAPRPRVPRRAVLVHPVRHRQPDPELRAAGADRHPDRRPQPGREPRVRRRRCCRSWRGCPAWSTCGSTRSRTSRRCSSTSIARCAAQAGFTQRDVANNLLVTLSGSGQTTPSFWLNPATGVSYAVATQTPQYRMDSLEDLRNAFRSAAAPARKHPAAREPRLDPPRRRAWRS